MPEIVQRSPEWYAQRLGRVTASRVADVCAKTKTGYSASRKNYLAELICERLTGERSEGYTNAAMAWGTDMEPHARAAYEFYTDVSVAEVGFVPHPSIADAGASPDGLVGSDGLLEIKCPNSATHIETLTGAGIDKKYLFQMQFQMACTGRQWCDFCSFDPRLPESMRLHIERVKRDDGLIAEIEGEIVSFLIELRDTVARLRAKYDPEPAEPLEGAAALSMTG